MCFFDVASSSSHTVIESTSVASHSNRHWNKLWSQLVGSGSNGGPPFQTHTHTSTPSPSYPLFLGWVYIRQIVDIHAEEEQGWSPFFPLSRSLFDLPLQQNNKKAQREVIRSAPVSDNESAAFLREHQNATETAWEAGTEHWMFLWFSELMVLSLGISDFGSSLWYFLQLRVLGVPCSNFFAFLGFVFEPAGALLVTCVTISTLILLRKSLVLQTRRQMKNSLTALWIISQIVTWVLPIVMGLLFWAFGRLGKVVDRGRSL